MTVLIAIVGRPNVGKSTLFNQLTRTRDAIVANEPGVTRDRQYGEGRYNERAFTLVDTGGIEDDGSDIAKAIATQASRSILEADVIFFVADARSGVMPGDRELANQLRSVQKPVYLLVNKTDGLDEHQALADFYQLGFDPYPIAAEHARGLRSVLELALDEVDRDLNLEDQDLDSGHDHSSAHDKPIRFAVLGKPNVGKSTLVNKILREDRVIACDMPGTTRDTIEIPFDSHERQFVLMDTAGVRRRKNVREKVEIISSIKALQAIRQVHVVIMVLDATQPISEQDLRLAHQVMEVGRGIVLTYNKWDLLDTEQKEHYQSEIKRLLGFVDFARQFHISAKNGAGTRRLIPAIIEAHRCAFDKIATSRLTQLLELAVKNHPPPVIKGRRVKLRYAHMGKLNPPTIVIHGKQTNSLVSSYRRYLTNFYREQFNWVGTPIHIKFEQDKNPYTDSSD